MSKRQFLIVIEKAPENYGAYSPDLLGCVATGKSRRETIKNMQEAIQIHVAGMLEDGLDIPKQTSTAQTISVELPPARKSRPRRSTAIRKTSNRKGRRLANGRSKRV